MTSVHKVHQMKHGLVFFRNNLGHSNDTAGYICFVCDMTN